MSVKIYALCDPESGETRYVGASCNPEGRIRGHLQGDHNTAKNEWVFALKAKGLKPLVKILEEVEIERAGEVELLWIQHFQSSESPLTNMRHIGYPQRERSRHPAFLRTVAQNIKTLRKERDWTQTGLGEGAGVDFRLVSRIESARYDMRLSTLEKIAQALDVHPADLLR